jgi:glycosyltransferase involved in cell wall biosynthesis
VLIRRFQSIRLNRLIGLELTVSVEALTQMTATLRDFAPDIVNAHHQYFTTTPTALWAARALGVPSVVTIHIGGLEAFTGWRGTMSRVYGQVVGQNLLSRADGLVAVSANVAETVSARHGQAVHVIPNGVDLLRFHPPGTRSPNLRTVFVGRLIANKGPHVALEAFRIVHEQLPRATLTIVGEGPMEADLRRYVDEHELEQAVTFLGVRRDVADILRNADLFLRPSQIEGMPLTILEAMATGLPVIACDVGGVREVVSDGLTGVLVAPGAVSDTAQALIALLTDQERASTMGEAALKRVQDGFTWDACAKANLDVFTKLTGGSL